MEIRKSNINDLPRMLEIYAYARELMVKTGNPHQWAERGWPPQALLEKDIEREKSYVCLHEGKIVGTFFFDFGKDIESTYARITNGAWKDESAYGVIHRIAADGSTKGIGTFCIEWAFSQCGHIRIDTHGDNIIMQNLLDKLGFSRCGTIYVEEDNYPRIAFEKSAE